MTEEQLKAEARYRYQERLGLMEVWGTPNQAEHNQAFVEANQAIVKLREENSMVSQLRQFRLSM